MLDIFMLTGWGVGSQPLTPLAEQLKRMGYKVTLADLPYQDEPQQWLADIAKLLPNKSIWLGWSLGGQLLSYLTQDNSQQCLGLVTLASNPCFKARQDWPCAMAVDTFSQFQTAYQQTPEQTLKRFLQLVVQGCPEPRTLVRELQRLSVVHSIKAANAGLTLLADIDARPSLQNYSGKQLHLLAEQDALVPASCAQELSQLIGSENVKLLPNTGHAFPMQWVQQTSQLLDDFIKKRHE